VGGGVQLDVIPYLFCVLPLGFSLGFELVFPVLHEFNISEEFEIKY
jgi:hypothetical protein